MSKVKRIGNTLFYEETNLPKHLFLEFDSYDTERYGSYYDNLEFELEELEEQIRDRIFYTLNIIIVPNLPEYVLNTEKRALSYLKKHYIKARKRLRELD